MRGILARQGGRNRQVHRPAASAGDLDELDAHAIWRGKIAEDQPRLELPWLDGHLHAFGFQTSQNTRRSPRYAKPKWSMPWTL